jgi:hypothetical protein
MRSERLRPSAWARGGGGAWRCAAELALKRVGARLRGLPPPTHPPTPPASSPPPAPCGAGRASFSSARAGRWAACMRENGQGCADYGAGRRPHRPAPAPAAARRAAIAKSQGACGAPRGLRQRVAASATTQPCRAHRRSSRAPALGRAQATYLDGKAPHPAAPCAAGAAAQSLRASAAARLRDPSPRTASAGPARHQRRWPAGCSACAAQPLRLVFGCREPQRGRLSAPVLVCKFWAAWTPIIRARAPFARL